MMISNLKYSIFQCHYTLHIATHLQWIACHMDIGWASAFWRILSTWFTTSNNSLSLIS